MKTIDIEIALMDYFNPRQNLIVPNISWGMNMHECDLLILTTSGYATEIEIKISKSDLLKDKEKIHSHIHRHIKSFYYAVPEKLKEIALSEIPDRSGLIIVKDGYDHRVWCIWKYMEIIKECENNKNAVKWNNSERLQMARLGAMRILALKKKVCKLFKEN